MRHVLKNHKFDQRRWRTRKNKRENKPADTCIRFAPHKVSCTRCYSDAILQWTPSYIRSGLWFGEDQRTRTICKHTSFKNIVLHLSKFIIYSILNNDHNWKDLCTYPAKESTNMHLQTPQPIKDSCPVFQLNFSIVDSLNATQSFVV